MAKKRKKRWSYNTGERGKTWVRAYEDRPGKFYLEWFEDFVDPVTGDASRKKLRSLLRGVDNARVARDRADDAAERFERIDAPAPTPLALKRLFHLYEKEVTPTKGTGKQGHDQRARRVFLAFFDAQEEHARRSDRHPATLDRTDWERFCVQREHGSIPGWGAVARRQVEYDLKHLIAVLNWATGAGEAGVAYLERNPWGAEIRRAQKWKMPKELNPTRVAMTDELRELLIDHSAHWQFGLALVLERDTRRRNNAVRQLRWNDLNLDEAWVEWRGETDKCGRANRTPLTARAVEALKKAPSRGLGATPVFPSASDPAEPTPRSTFQTWMRRAKAAAGIRIRGLGYHSEKRAGVRDPAFRALPPAIQEELAGTNYETLKNVYDEVTVADMRAAMQEMERRTA